MCTVIKRELNRLVLLVEIFLLIAQIHKPSFFYYSV